LTKIPIKAIRYSVPKKGKEKEMLDLIQFIYSNFATVLLIITFIAIFYIIITALKQMW